MNDSEFKKRQREFMCRNMSKEEIEVRRIVYKIAKKGDPHYEQCIQEIMKIIDAVESAERLWKIPTK